MGNSTITDADWDRLMAIRVEDDVDWTLEEIAAVLGCTRERVRQIQNIALKKLLHPKRSKELIMFLDGHEASEPLEPPPERDPDDLPEGW